MCTKIQYTTAISSGTLYLGEVSDDEDVSTESSSQWCTIVNINDVYKNGNDSYQFRYQRSVYNGNARNNRNNPFTQGNWMCYNRSTPYNYSVAYHVTSVNTWTNFRGQTEGEAMYDQVARVSDTVISATKTYKVGEITAEYGTYPFDGVHMDGYYYALKTA